MSPLRQWLRRSDLELATALLIVTVIAALYTREHRLLLFCLPLALLSGLLASRRHKRRSRLRLVPPKPRAYSRSGFAILEAQARRRKAKLALTAAAACTAFAIVDWYVVTPQPMSQLAAWALQPGLPQAEPDGDDPALFACSAPSHHDGDAIRCDGDKRSMRLYAIDAPEMPGSCRPGRACTPGDPYASRDHLASLTRGKRVECRQVDTDRYGRPVVQCLAGDVDLSCAMVRDGFAVERYGSTDC